MTALPAAGGLSLAVVDEPHPETVARWDELVRRTPGGDVAQLSGWARLRGTLGYRALYLWVHRGEEVLGGAQILLRRLPLLGAVGYVSNGPVVDSTEGSGTEVRRLLDDGLAELAATRVKALFVQPPEGAAEVTADLLRRGFRPSEAGIAPAASAHIDLNSSEQELRRNLSKRLRTWTNQWPARGVTVRTARAGELPTIAGLLADTARHQGFDAVPADYLRRMFDELSPTGNIVAQVGEVDGDPVAVDVLTVCGGTVKVRFIGLDRSAAAIRLNVSAAVRWEAIRWAKANGYRWFDLGGLHPESVRALSSGRPFDRESLPGGDQAKLRFGGTPYRYPEAVEAIAPPILRRAYDLGRRSRTGKALIARAKTAARRGSLDPRPSR